MRGGVAQDVAPIRRIDRDALDGVTVDQLVREVLQFAIDAGGDDVGRLGKQLPRLRPCIDLLRIGP